MKEHDSRKLETDEIYCLYGVNGDVIYNRKNLPVVFVMLILIISYIT